MFFSSFRLRLIQVLMIASAILLPALFACAEEAPPIPPGFESTEDTMKALATGKVSIINAAPSLPEGVTEELGIEYGEGSGHPLLLDLYRPEKIEGKVPGLIFIHGGGWEKGGREVYKFYTCRFAERGFVAVTIQYRLSGEAPFPAAVEDCKCAVRWMRCNAEKYHIDPDRIAVIGGSAGGHLSMMVGYSSDVTELEGEGGHPTQSSKVAAVVNFYGPTDLTTDFARTKGMVKKFVGGKTYAEAPELYEAISPLHYLTPDDPPTLTFHGSIDDIVPISQAEALVAKLDELGIPNVYDPFPGWPHTMDLAKPVNDRCMFIMDRFFEEHLHFPETADTK